MDPIAFQQKWIGATLTERSASQSHFNDLCAVVGHPTPIALDPTGDTFTFERGATKSIGGSGCDDVDPDTEDEDRSFARLLVLNLDRAT
jgi:hypothetical protein